jgi:hypothetical protein
LNRIRPTSAFAARVAAALLLLAPAVAAASPAIHFQVTDLNGAVTEIPAGLPQPRALLLLGFRHSDQAALDAWRQGMGLRAEDADWFEVPVIGVGSPMIRSMIVHGMQRRAAGKAERARLAPAFAAAATIAGQLGVDSGAPAVVVVDRAGNVLARSSGSFDQAKATALSAALRP